MTEIKYNTEELEAMTEIHPTDEEMEDVLLHLKTLYDVCMDGVSPYLEKNFEKLIKY